MPAIHVDSLAFKGAGVSLILVGVGYMVYSAVSREVAPPCSARYPAATEFSLTSEAGLPMTPAELQARTGSEGWGLLENASVATPKGAPSRAVLNVKLAGAGAAANADADATGGIGFRWAPGSLDTANAACLRYRVWLPKNFGFGEAGVLPGLFGGDAGGEGAFSSRLVWSKNGAGGLGLEAPGTERGKSQFIPGEDFAFATERWTDVEQELVVNAPGQKNGVVRLWVDGELVLERTDAMLRTDDASVIRGVVADVGYGGVRRPEDSAQASLSLTPLAVSWQ